MRDPDWLEALPADQLVGDHAAMAYAVSLARRNVAHGTGGPFGAVVVAGDGSVVGRGVNTVEASGTSLAHAEVNALLDAQRRVGRPRLNGDDAGGPWALVTTAQPCVMCFGALFWAGLDALVVGARTSDVEELAGFDEGPLPTAWREQLEGYGIAVRADVDRGACREVLAAYAASGGTLY